MSALDWFVIVVDLAGTLGLSAWRARMQRTPADYDVGGRTLPWWALALSILATQSSANSFPGIPAFVALVPGGGLTWLQYELMLPLAMVLIMLVLVPVLRGLELISVYECLERRFDRATRQVLSAVFLLSRGLATGVAVYAAAVVVQVCSGLPLAWCIVTGLLAAVGVTLLVSRALPPPAPEQLQGTTISAAALRWAWAAERGPYTGLLIYGAVMTAVAVALGVR